jgi:hypothetical protein
VSNGYKRYIHPPSERDEWAKNASYEELREALTWALEAESEAHEEYTVFADALGELLAERAALRIQENQQ